MRELLERSVADKANMPDALIARYLAPYVGQDGLNHLLALARAVDDEDMAEVDLGQIDRPSLIVWGDQDPFVSPKLGDRLADTIPGQPARPAAGNGPPGAGRGARDACQHDPRVRRRGGHGPDGMTELRCCNKGLRIR